MLLATDSSIQPEVELPKICRATITPAPRCFRIWICLLIVNYFHSNASCNTNHFLHLFLWHSCSAAQVIDCCFISLFCVLFTWRREIIFRRDPPVCYCVSEDIELRSCKCCNVEVSAVKIQVALTL